MGASVGIRELRQNLSRYIERVKAGESLTVTERGREVARILPAGPKDSPLARLISERGATMPTVDLLDLEWDDGVAPDATPSMEVLDALREDRL